MKGLIDTHTHLDSFNWKGLLDNALEAAANAEVFRMITVGTEPEDWQLYSKMADEHPGRIDYTVGLHPCSVEGNWEEAADGIKAYFDKEAGPAGVGEIGLDRFHLPKDRKASEEIFERQVAAFKKQLAIAKELGCPIVIHSRGAFSECVEVIDKSGVDWSKVIFHCFSEGPGEMQQLIDRGGYGSFTGIITFKNAESIREAALLQGLDKLMVETDAPYLAPMPHRGKRNEPAYVRFTAEFCAELFGVSFEALAEKTTETAMAVYGLK